MKMHDKLLRAQMMAQRIKSVAKSLEFTANDYDCSWPMSYVTVLTSIADDYLNLK